jgi:hypothetical protein
VWYLRGAASGTDWATSRSLARARNTGDQSGKRVQPLAVAAAGDFVAVVYRRTRYGACGDASCLQRVIQLRWSSDRGQTWGPQRTVPFDIRGPLDAEILGGRLLLAWTNRSSAAVLVVRSTDGGATFSGPRRAGEVGDCDGPCQGHATFAATATRVALLWHGDGGQHKLALARSDAAGRFDGVKVLPGAGPAGSFSADARGTTVVAAYRASGKLHVTTVVGSTAQHQVVASDTSDHTLEAGGVALDGSHTVLGLGRISSTNGRERIGTMTRVGSGAWGGFVALPWSSGGVPRDATAPAIEVVPAGLSFVFEQLFDSKFGKLPQIRWLLLED